MVASYCSAVNDANNELVHLFEITEAAETDKAFAAQLSALDHSSENWNLPAASPNRP
jgi:hypothetical protein